MGFQNGVFNITQNPSELNARSFAGQILRRFPNGSAPLFALTSRFGRSRAKSTTHGYFSKTMSFTRLVSSAALVGATTLGIPAGTAGLTQYMLLHNIRTRENVRIESITDATNIVVTRAFGREAAAAVNANDVWVQAGTAFPEGSDRPVARRMTMVYIPNYTGIFRNAWALTDTARASMSEQGYSNIAENRQDCMALHSTDIESGMIFSQKKMDTTGTQPVHTTQGIVDAVAEYAPTHIVPMAATTNYAELRTAIETALESSTNVGSPNDRLLVGDARAIQVIADIGRKSGEVQIMQEEDSFGMRYTSFKTQRGNYALMDHPLLNGLGLTGFALVLDMPAIKLAYLDGRDTKPEEYGSNGKILENGVDAVGGSLTTEFALELLNPYGCAVLTGLTAGVAEA